MLSVKPVRLALFAAVLVGCLCMPSKSFAASHDATEAQIMRALNDARASHGLPRLKASGALARAAGSHSRDMRNANSLDHGDFVRRLRRYVRSRHIGENIAWLSGCDPAQVVQMWMDSPPHREIMLSRSYELVGVGRSGSGECYVTADFASAG